MMPRRVSSTWLLLTVALHFLLLDGTLAFQASSSTSRSSAQLSVSPRTSSVAPRCVVPTNDAMERNSASATPSTSHPSSTIFETANVSLAELKSELLDLVPRMTGQASEHRRVEAIVNAMESHALNVPAQTLGFFQLAVQGSWQLLFGTQLTGTPNPRQFRLRETMQTLHIQDGNNNGGNNSSNNGNIHGTATGNLTNRVRWDWAQEGDAPGTFSCTGTFAVESLVAMNASTTGSRISIANVTDHIMVLSPGSAVPTNVPALVGVLHQSMPKELFDPSDHAFDTTFVDATVRIVRYTGPRLEGVRDIWIRSSPSQ